MIPRRAILALVGLACFWTPAATAQEPAGSGVEERVTVRLAEVRILVTDKRGNPVSDLRDDEIEVREDGRRRKLAYLEAFATGEKATASAEREATESADAAAERPPVIVIPPAPRRTIVLLFDPYNSRMNDRDRWVEAARDWVQQEMRETDLVSIAVMHRAEVRIVVRFTSRKEPLLDVLMSGSILSGITHHDYIDELRNLMDDLQTCVPAYEPQMCSLSAVQAYIHEWRVRTEQAMGGLRRFSASLGAIPGRKAVYYMSDGLVMNPGELATSAVLATLGTEQIAYNQMSFTLRNDLYVDVLQSMRVAATADVTFFTFDTRHSSMRDVSWMAEQRVALNERMVSDPFARMFDETRATLTTVALQTGGRAFHGPNIEENLPRAIRAFEGLYAVGYYRAADAKSAPKVKVKIARKGLEVSYPDRTALEKHRPLALRLELAVAHGRPQLDGILLPLVAQLPLGEVDFRKEDGLFKSEIAFFAEAVSPGGERAADVFEIVEVQLTEEEYRTRATRHLAHAVGLTLPPGSYRLRARLSDADFRHKAERSLDVTVAADGTTRAGIQESAAIQETGPGAGADTPH